MLHGGYFGTKIHFKWVRGILILQLVAFQAATSISVAPLPEGDERCTGLKFDLSRLRRLSGSQVEDIQPLSAGTTSYKMNQVIPIRISDEKSENGRSEACVVQRLRLYEQMNGIPIYGADTVVTLDECYEEVAEAGSAGATSSLAQRVETYGLKGFSIRDLSGNSFDSVSVKTGYEPKHSHETVINFLAKEYGVDKDSRDMGQPKLYIFPSKQGDYLAYFVNLLIHTMEGKGNTTKAIRVIVDAETLDILSTCLLSASPLAKKKRNHGHLRKQQKQLESRQSSSFCTTCAVNRTIGSFTSTTSTQQIRSLYLDNTGKNAEVTQVMLADGGFINVAGPVDDVYWSGTFHCFSQQNGAACNWVELPTSCDDALSDVAYVAVETLRFLQSELLFSGGLSRSSVLPPQYSAAAVHYGSSYCGAFYVNNVLIFGDCDCSFYTPLVSLDIVAKVLGYGVTEYTSGLEYSGESGGLNEGFSDILGTVMEYYINDSTDTPDFRIGERLEGFGEPISYMENPPTDGLSIGSICDYYDGLDVHFSSGVLNKAMVKSVRACEADPCSTSERECVLLMGKLWLYVNSDWLLSFDNFLDAAKFSCVAIGEFFSTISPATSCTQSQVQSFLTDGWSSVDITIDGTGFDCTAIKSCSTPTPAPTAMTGTDPSVGCDNAQFLEVPFNGEGTTINAPSYNSVACNTARNHQSPGGWISIIGTGGTVVASLCDTTTFADSMLSVWTGDCDNLQCVDGNDDFCSLFSEVTFPTVSGQTYYIYIYGYFGQTFDFNLTLTSTTAAPTIAPMGTVNPSIGCSAATPLAIPANIKTSTMGMQVYNGTLLACGTARDSDSAGLWYSIVGTGAQIEVSTCAFADYDTMIGVWTGSCGSLICADGNDDACGLQSNVSFPSTASQTYYIYVYGYFGAVGAFELNVSEVAAPTPPGLSMEDGCLSATRVAVGETITNDTGGRVMTVATECLGAYSITSPGIWYSVQGVGRMQDIPLDIPNANADGADLVASFLDDTTYETMISIWTGTCANLECVAGVGDRQQSSVKWSSSGSKTYYIFVHGYAAATGTFNLKLSVDEEPTTIPVTRPPTPAPVASPPTGGPAGGCNSVVPSWVTDFFRGFDFGFGG